MQRERLSPRSNFASEALPPLSHDDSEEFLSQYVKQRKARDKYTKEWVEIRETIQDSITSKQSSKTSKSDKKINSQHRPRSSRKKGKEKHPPQMFNHFTLNKDPEVSKYMPYDSVAYPKMDRGIAGPSHAAEMETMWMSGLLDYTEHSATKILGGNVAPFCALPGPGILPAAKKELRKMEKKREKTIVENADYTPRFEEHDNEGDEKRAEKAHHALASDELSQLRRLARSLEPTVKKTNYERNMDVYKKENKKIKRVLAGEKPIKAEVTVSSEAMADVFEMCRKEYVASLSIQRFWRRYLLRRQWKLRMFQALQVRKIQAAARGFISRRLVASWYQERLRLAIQWAARIRGGLRIVKFRRILALEIRSVTHMQRVVRGALARRRFIALRRAFHAVQIQRLWRGCTARAFADRTWLTLKVIILQARVRGLLCRLQLANLSTERGEKARDIQRCWRGFFDRKIRDVRLFDRETIFREKVVAELASEGSYWHNELLNKQRIYRKKGFEQADADLVTEGENLNLEIKELEANYVEMMRQRRQISPRGLEQGWREELDESTKNHREMITDKKLTYNFDIMLKCRSNNEKMLQMKEQLSVARFTSDKFNDWREEEIASGLNRENTHKHEQALTLHQKEVAHERRKWQVSFHMASGKPDKKRRPGRPWDSSVFSKKDTFCGGAADVFAFNQSVDKLRMGSESSLQKIMGQVQTQNFLNEVQGLDGLLKPLVKPLQEMQHDTPLWEEKQKEEEHRKKYPWVPSNDEMGVNYSAQSPAPPRNPLRPPRPPGYPDPAVVEGKKPPPNHDSRPISEATSRKSHSVNNTSRESESSLPVTSEESVLGDGATSNLDAFARERARRQERIDTEAKRKVRTARSKAARRHRPLISRIPWTLLDELEAEKHKLSMEKALSGFTKT